MTAVFSVAVLIYPGADILDFSGPLEIFSTGPPADKPRTFITTTFSHHNPVKASANAMTLVPDASFTDVESKLEDYDVLVVPGGDPRALKAYLETKEGKEIAALIKKFSELKPRKEQGSRVLQSVCTGTLLLAASGILENRTVTTHHIAYDLLKQMSDEAAGGESHINVVRKRWVDAGTTEAGVRIVNAGGVSSGIDASLWVVEQLAGKEIAEWTAEIVEFERRNQEAGWGV
ncbi:class I glutamine amidotransferase-like protein [Melanomma pulvis-pyrius CBS 109.77]|uniref:Class I glutamine amidotransferase-like protein n=1 Tax=Melanomma pulvis-pyrius CBS 109.77 TaxID=1314802 RepID=A0A6A6XIY1_9PLEO|nr:class I glutamine amidotransferase-like protein [Melanomma pulvis-pyrius CBS 109.77]